VQESWLLFCSFLSKCASRGRTCHSSLVRKRSTKNRNQSITPLGSEKLLPAQQLHIEQIVLSLPNVDLLSLGTRVGFGSAIIGPSFPLGPVGVNGSWPHSFWFQRPTSACGHTDEEGCQSLPSGASAKLERLVTPPHPALIRLPLQLAGLFCCNIHHQLRLARRYWAQNKRRWRLNIELKMYVSHLTVRGLFMTCVVSHLEMFDMPLSSSVARLSTMKEFKTSRRGLVQVYEHFPRRAYLELTVPDDALDIRKAPFLTRSRDQGGRLFDCSGEEHEAEPVLTGPLQVSGAQTTRSVGSKWLFVVPAGEATLRRSRSTTIYEEKVQEYATHWDANSASPRIAFWLRQVRPGDIIELVPKAHFQA